MNDDWILPNWMLIGHLTGVLNILVQVLLEILQSVLDLLLSVEDLLDLVIVLL